jgi:hypothetical protein
MWEKLKATKQVDFHENEDISQAIQPFPSTHRSSQNPKTPSFSDPAQK